ncbi:glycosyltransferase [Microcella sp.]|uniref:glycosyltransferase n=1 Tax=Microcella sp. TaxID=1913979 RepID=UPI002562C066|nr:glycosyltransferase [Microcella sp.]MBX9472756.1 glycosyltransferase [Microcella sp.]
MQPRVIAILLARRGGEVLQQTLDALAAQSRRPDLLVVVDAAGDDETTAQLSAAGPTQFVSAGTSVALGELVHRALMAVPPVEPASSPYGGVDEWLWLLRHDTTPDPRALERLLGAVEIAPSVAVAGPKQLEAEHPTVIAGFGETMTRYGASIALAERELDQAQHDRTSDVLAMGEAGLLVRRAAYHQVEGFDPALTTVDAALDLCVRIRLAGHRVVGVPQARVFVHEGTVLAGRPGSHPKVSQRGLARLRRRAQLHRRLTYAPALAVPLHWLSLLPLAIVRALGHLLRKRPTLVGAEFAAALSVAFSGSAVPNARRRLARGRTMGWAAIDPLRLPPDEVRQRRAIARDARLSAQEDSRPPRPAFAPGGALVVVLAALLGAALLSPLIGAPALLGGAFAPIAADLPALLGALERTVEGAADPFAFVLALLGLTTFWQPSLSLVVLVLVALPLAALGGWWATAELVRRPGPAAVGAVLWALSPALIVAVTEGRPAAIVAHLALPWLVVAAARAGRSWSAAGAAGLLGAIVAASAPSLVPALLFAWLAWILVNPRQFGRLLTLPVPALALFAPLVIDQLVRGTPLGLLADPGLPAVTGASSPTGLLLGWPDLALLLAPLEALLPGFGEATLLGLPLVGVVLALLMLPVVALALLGLALPDGRRGLVPLVLAALGLLSAWALSGVAVSVAGGQLVPIDVGPALSLTALGLVLAAAIGLDGLGARPGTVPGSSYAFVAGRGAAVRGRRMLAAVLATLAVLAAAVVAAPAATTVLTGTAAVRAGEPRTLPALVAAEAATDPGLGTLVITPLETGVAARLDRGTGVTLAEQRTMLSTAVLSGSGLPGTSAQPFGISLLDTALVDEVPRGEATFAEGDGVVAADAQSLATIVANLVAPSGRDLTPELDALDVRFVLLDSPAGEANSAVAALDGNAQLAPVGDTDAGRLYRVVADDESRAASTVRPATTPVILGVQLSILALTLLLAAPTSLRARRPRVDSGVDEGPAATFEAGDDDD